MTEISLGMVSKREEKSTGKNRNLVIHDFWCFMSSNFVLLAIAIMWYVYTCVL